MSREASHPLHLREVLDSAHASHLAARLNRHDEDGATCVRPSAEEVDIGNLFGGVLARDLRLDEGVLGQDVGIFGIAVGVELGQGLEGSVGAVVVGEPSPGKRSGQRRSRQEGQE